jgi:Homing endonuclease associated repeat
MLTMEPRVADMHAKYSEGASLREVGEEHGLSGERVRQLFVRNGLKTRSPDEVRAAQKVARKAAREKKRKGRRSTADWIEKKYSDAELLEILQEANRAVGGVLTVHRYDRLAKQRNLADGRPWPTHQTHFHRFGSWRQALLAAGLTANPSSAIAGQRLFDVGHCIDAIRHVAREVGAQPTVSEYESIARASNGALPSAATVRNRCGSWGEALRQAEA